MSNFAFHPAATAEYYDALARYAAASPHLARRFETAIDDAVAKVVAMPLAYPPLDGRHRAFVLKKFSYQLVYRQEPNGIAIIAVAHTSRRPGYWKGR